MLQEDIYTRNLVLSPMMIKIESLGAWSVLKDNSPMGFVVARKKDNAVALEFCLTSQSRPYYREIIRGLTDVLLLSFPCDYVEAHISLQDTSLREALEEEGYASGVAFSQPNEAGKLIAQMIMRLNRFDWFGLDTTRPFEDVQVIEGEKIDLHCTYTMDANVEKGYSPAYCFEIAPHGEMQSVGRIDLRLGYTENTYYGGNIGYGLQEAWRGRGFAAEACRMLMPLIERHGMRRVVITCSTDNMPSRGTCENLGAMYVRHLAVPEHLELYENGYREICMYHWTAKKEIKK